MQSFRRALALSLVLYLVPACAALAPLDAPVAAAHRPDQRAYALLVTYAALVEEAAEVAADPATPLEAKRALAQAERAASPVVQALAAAIAAYLAAGETEPEARTQAALRLEAAADAASAPIRTLEILLRGRG